MNSARRLCAGIVLIGPLSGCAHGTAPQQGTAPMAAPMSPTTQMAPSRPVYQSSVPQPYMSGEHHHHRFAQNGGYAPSPVSAPMNGYAPSNVAPSAGYGQVWVNTKSGVYHVQGDPEYGNTKHGEYMTEAAAQATGYRPAGRR